MDFQVVADKLNFGFANFNLRVKPSSSRLDRLEGSLEDESCYQSRHLDHSYKGTVDYWVELATKLLRPEEMRIPFGGGDYDLAQTKESDDGQAVYFTLRRRKETTIDVDFAVLILFSI